MAKMLIIENEAAHRLLMRRFLERGGYEYVEAGSGTDGIEAIAHTSFDLVVCDALMPVQGGIETIQRIRELDASIPIIAVSGAFGAEGFSPRDDTLAMGADQALHKPFNAEVSRCR